MYKVLKADKDTYITDRVIDDERQTGSNVGSAGSLDLFKLYGITSSGSYPNIELSRLLVHFDLDPLRTLISQGKLDTNDASFSCHLKLFDVYGGQPTPRDFTVVVHPMSRSFEEGLGRDVVFYNDNDVSNFITGSRAQGSWIMSGANAGGLLGSSVDYIASAIINGQTASFEATQYFRTGVEDLYVDVTSHISATLAEILSDEGFRIAFTSSIENDDRTYYVKRFASHTAYNEDKHPRLIVRFDDSIQDDSNNLTFDASSSLYLYNYVHGQASSLMSASMPVTGNLILKLSTAISGGFYELAFTGSRAFLGSNVISGAYKSSVYVPSTDPILATKLVQSGSVKFTPIWGSVDGTLTFLTGSEITVWPPTRGSSTIEPKQYIVSVTGLKNELFETETTTLRVNIFDESLPKIFKVKRPVNSPGTVVRSVFYAIRDVVTDITIIPFDTIKNSTRVSSDGSGMYFKLDVSNLVAGRLYVIDILISSNDNDQIYRSASAAFKVVPTL